MAWSVGLGVRMEERGVTGVWFWNYTNDDGETNQMFMEPEDDVRFKVTSIKFNSAPSQEEIKSNRGNNTQATLTTPTTTPSFFTREGPPFRH